MMAKTYFEIKNMFLNQSAFESSRQLVSVRSGSPHQALRFPKGI
jgi:hypothetical protein